MREFKKPEPMPGETYDSYFLRLIDEFERWVNQNYKPEERDAHS